MDDWAQTSYLYYPTGVGGSQETSSRLSQKRPEMHCGNYGALTQRLKNLLVCLFFIGVGTDGLAQDGAGIRKVCDVLIYQDSLFYNAFPSVVKTQNGELLVAFRRAPNRQMYGESGNRHVDHNSYLVGCVRPMANIGRVRLNCFTRMPSAGHCRIPVHGKI